MRLADGTPVGEPITDHVGSVNAVAVGTLQDGTPIFVIGDSVGSVEVRRLTDGARVGEPITDHVGSVNAVAVGTLQDGTPIVVSGSDCGIFNRIDGEARVWQLPDGDPIGDPLTSHDGSVNAVAVGTLPGGARVIVIGSGGDSESESESARGKHDNVGRRIRKVHGHQRSP